MRLESVILSQDGQQNPILLTNLEPVQVTSIYYGLVKIVAPTKPLSPPQIPQVCPGENHAPVNIFKYVTIIKKQINLME